MDMHQLMQDPIVTAIAGGVIGLVAGFFVGYAVPKKKRIANKKFKNLPPGAVEIYIGNLSYDTTEDYLRKEFEKFGAVASVRIITNHFTHKSKGFGFIEMPNRSEAEKLSLIHIFDEKAEHTINRLAAIHNLIKQSP